MLAFKQQSPQLRSCYEIKVLANPQTTTHHPQKSLSPKPTHTHHPTYQNRFACNYRV